MRSLPSIGWTAYLLCLAIGSLGIADQSWKSVTQHRSTYALEQTFEAGPAIASDVVIVLLDGLRTDAVAGLAAYQGLARRGASGTMRVAVPSLSNPGRAALLTGAWPEVSGVTNNSTFEPVPVQSLFGLARQRGLGSEVYGTRFWPRAFGGLVQHAGPSRRYASDEVEELVRWQSDCCEEALQRLQRSDAAIRVVDLWASDEAGHVYGGASAAYREVLAAVDSCLGRIAQQEGPEVTLAALSDHGHIDRRGRGGHGGLEPEVMNAPFVLAGPGVRPAHQIEAEMVDIAPTISTLLGLPIPANSQGRVLWEALDVPAEHAALLRQLEEEQRAALAAHMPDRTAALKAQQAERMPWSILSGLCLLAATLGVVHWQRRHWASLCAAAAVFLLAYFALFYAFGLGYSLSAIVRQEYLYSFLAKNVAAAAMATGVAALAVFRGAGRRFEAAVGVAVLVASPAAMAVAWTHFRYGLLMDGWMLEIGPAFQAYMHMIAIVGIALGVLLVGAVNRLAPGRQGAS